MIKVLPLLFLLISLRLAALERFNIPDVFVSALVSDEARKEVWVGTYNGIYVFRESKLAVTYPGPEFTGISGKIILESSSGLSSRFVTSLMLTDKFCLAGTDRSLDIIDRETGKQEKTFQRSQVSGFLQLGKYILCASFDGLSYLDENLELAPISHLKENLAPLDYTPISGIYFQSPTRNIWVVLTNGGCVKISKDDQKKYLGNVRIKSISGYEDKVCFAAEDSLLVFNGYSWQRIRSSPFGNLPSKKVLAVFDGGNSLLLATDTGVYKYDNVLFKPLFEDSDILNQTYVRSFLKVGKNLLLGTQKNGIYLVKEDS
ncbi:MAG: hypothetical protein PHW04_17260 [Candidatus Wallbacteria bacterium]|nr:hypothetical protein [Candidatus Wallbacteria bacterium]